MGKITNALKSRWRLRPAFILLILAIVSQVLSSDAISGDIASFGFLIMALVLMQFDELHLRLDQEKGADEWDGR